jgi:ATP-dependent RNA helicase DbpA
LSTNPITHAFSELPLHSALIESLERSGYETMTDIQAAALPALLEGGDLIGKAKTGSGKTATFALTLLNKLRPKNYYIQSLILCPTRELAVQVADEVRKLAKAMHNVKVLTICGGKPIGPQIGSLEHGAHIIVGTPGRIQDHLRKETLDLSRVETLVLDEADRMLDMGFLEDVEQIARACPKNRQTLLFSATYPEKIASMANRIMRSPIEVSVESQHSDAHIEQRVIEVEDSDKPELLARILRATQVPTAIIFANMKQDCDELASYLIAQGASALALHGDLEQRERDSVLTRFSQGSCRFLVATDVAARGLDVDDVALVVNVDLPRDDEVYVHRIGRTGRAGNTGKAYSFFTSKQTYKLQRLEDERKQALQRLDAKSFKARGDFLEADWVTLEISGGKRDKVRPGDLLGALTVKEGIQGSDVGNIQIIPNASYVAVRAEHARHALNILNEGNIKGRKFRARKLK